MSPPTIIPAIAPGEVAGRVLESGCRTLKVKVAAPGQSPVASMIEDLTEKLNRSPQKRLEQMIEADEAQAAEILKRWLLREAA